MIARVAGALALALAAVMVVLVLGSGPRTRTYDVLFQTAGQLVKDDDVQVGGRRVGAITDIRLTSDNQARVRIEVEEPFAPLREGTTAVIRATSLSGVANRYIALDVGPQSNRALADGSVIEADRTTTIVDLDQLFNALDPAARRNLQKVVRGFSTQLKGRGEEAGRAIEQLNPFLSVSRRLAGELAEDEQALTGFLVSSSKMVGALASRRAELAQAVTGTRTAAGAVGRESAALERALTLLPTTLRRANSTFVNLRATLDDLDPLVQEAEPAARRLEPVLRRLRPLVGAARPTVADLRRLLRRPGPRNDLVDATRALPRLQRAASPAFGHAREALVGAQPVLEFLRPYTPELLGWIRDYGQGASNYDANGHFARIQPIFNAFSFTDTPAGGVLSASPPARRLDSLQTGYSKRCPGGASQPAADGSSPYPDGVAPGDCDPAAAPPGP